MGKGLAWSHGELKICQGAIIRTSWRREGKKEERERGSGDLGKEGQWKKMNREEERRREGGREREVENTV